MSAVTETELCADCEHDVDMHTLAGCLDRDDLGAECDCRRFLVIVQPAAVRAPGEPQ